MENQTSNGVKKIYSIGIGVAGIVTVFIFANLFSNRGNDNVPQKSEAIKTMPVLIPQTNDEGGVVVAVTPKDQSDWSFEITLTTHSGNLGEDLGEVSVLADEMGDEYRRVEWEGDPPGGHHRRGVIRFGEITPSPHSIILTIRQVGGVDERKFEWIIQL